MKRILIIEDDASIAELERDYLEIEGFDIQWVDNGQTGLRKALDEDFSLILLDVMLPPRRMRLSYPERNQRYGQGSR